MFFLSYLCDVDFSFLFTTPPSSAVQCSLSLLFLRSVSLRGLKQSRITKPPTSSTVFLDLLNGFDINQDEEEEED